MGFYFLWYNVNVGLVAQWIEQFRPKEKVVRSTRTRVTKNGERRRKVVDREEKWGYNVDILNDSRREKRRIFYKKGK